MAKKIIYFFGIFAYAIGVIGGFGTAVYNGEYVIAASVVVLAAMAAPAVKKFVNRLME